MRLEYKDRIVLIDDAWRPWILSTRLQRALATLDWFMSGVKPRSIGHQTMRCSKVPNK